MRHDDVPIPGGRFRMGDGFAEGEPGDGETPVHPVLLSPFRLDRFCVSNAQFAAFVADTGHVTAAERWGSSAVFAPFVAADPEDLAGAYPTSWWVAVRGANWRQPFGRHSGIRHKGDHPVVHVSHDDALAYCRWSGRRLPTEAEWEYAARGGAAGQRYPWGDELEPEGQHRANVWQGQFPAHNSLADGWADTAPVASFPPNGFGLFQTVGNVWEWCADWFDAGWYRRSPPANPVGPDTGTRRVMRGGSYLCHASYCSRYRVAARNANTPDSSTCNIGFRTAADA